MNGERITRKLLNSRRQGHRARHLRASRFGRLYDLAGGLIKNLVIKRLEPNSDLLRLLSRSCDHLVLLSGLR